MSAIVAAAQQIDRARRKAAIRNNRSEWDRWYAMGLAAGRAIVAASNAACRAMVVQGAPRTWAIRWSPPLWPTGRGWIARDGWWRVLAYALSPHAGLRPCWNAANRLWVWGTAVHDPRPCAWLRPFARGATP